MCSRDTEGFSFSWADVLSAKRSALHACLPRLYITTMLGVNCIEHQPCPTKLQLW